jgi:membrane fusion protein (multidrug efflux system)
MDAKRSPIIHTLIALAFLLIPGISCDNTSQNMVIPPPKVKVVQVIVKDTPVYQEFVGQMYGLKDIPIRARVDGFLEDIRFNEGTRVSKGQLLYTIDPQPFEAKVAGRKSELAEAQTLLVNAENELRRYKPLAEIDAVSKSDLDAAQATRDAAESSVEAARANLRLAEINLSYTRIQSPIDGLIGKTEAREGEYVGKSPNPVILNTVSRIDTMRVQFFLTEADYLTFVKEYIQSVEAGTNGPRIEENEGVSVRENNYNLDLILSDGSVYEQRGRVDFINRNIDPKTGSILLEAHFPNTKKILRPGLYAKVRAQMEVIPGAKLVPQRCISEMQGQFSVIALTDSSTIQKKQVELGPIIGDMVIVLDGLEKDEKIVFSGLQKAVPGMKVDATVVDFESQIPTN